MNLYKSLIRSLCACVSLSLSWYVSLCLCVSVCLSVCVLSLGKKMTRQEDQKHIFNFVQPYVGNIFLWNDNKIYNVASATWASSAAYECDMWVTILCMHIPPHVHFMTTYTGICLLGYIISLHACDYFDIIGQGKLIPWLPFPPACFYGSATKFTDVRPGIKELILLVLDVVTGIAIIIGDRKGGAIELQSQLILRIPHRMVIFYH